VRGQTGNDRQGCEGEGEVIALAVRPVPLAELDASDELLQSGFWGRFKEAHGWKPHSFCVSGGGGDFPLLVLTRPVLAKLSLAYVPFGPVADPRIGRGAFLSDLSRALRPHLPQGTFFLRFDLPWEKKGELPRARGVVKAASDMQPASTVVVDIAPPLEQVLASMKSKTRYNVRLAAKKGVVVQEARPEEMGAWYTLYEETARRDRIGIHARAYYEGLVRASAESGLPGPVVRLLLARHEGKVLAGNIVAFWRSRAAYLYGASSGEGRNLMPTYALQWEAIRLAKEARCTTYDLFGVPPRPDPSHPMYGLYQFKTGFSDCVLERWGTWDAPFRPFAYWLYRGAEALRMFYYRRLRKVLRGRSRNQGAGV
jgi:lipid II:glycine glycyltransferase (peptidoglycan interpeptide bridge formation enzyme)